MEFPLNQGPCIDYDLDQERLLVARGADTHEIQVRAQVHRLVRHMVERNAAGGGTPALCTHAELMEAVWGDEPLHDRTELARLVWELRRQLEAVGAAALIETAPRRGYRLVTCQQVADAAPAAETPVGMRPRRALLIVVALVGIAAVAAVAAVLATRPDGSKTPGSGDVQLATFVDRIENVLVQSAAGRSEIQASLSAGLACRVAPDDAARRISSVADNRQSILEQLGSLATPSAEAARMLTLLQRALQQSIETDRHYRDGFLETQAGASCPLRPNSGFQLAAKSDPLATAAKRAFLAVFNPIAQRFGRRTWSVDRI